MTASLLSQLLKTELTTIQKELVEQYLYELLIAERIEKQLECIKTTVSDEISDMSNQEIIDILRIKLG